MSIINHHHDTKTFMTSDRVPGTTSTLHTVWLVPFLQVCCSKKILNFTTNGRLQVNNTQNTHILIIINNNNKIKPNITSTSIPTVNKLLHHNTTTHHSQYTNIMSTINHYNSSSDRSSFPYSVNDGKKNNDDNARMYNEKVWNFNDD